MKLMIISAVAFAASAAAAVAQPSGPSSSGPSSRSATAQSATPTTASDYVRAAGASDHYEITSSKAVLTDARNEDVRRFAQMMIDHHTMTTRDVTGAAKAAGMTPPPPAPDARKAAMLQELQAASGEARERLYARQQATAHEEALALHGGYASNGDNPQLRAVAAKAVPIIQQHLTEIRRINTALD